MVAKKKKKKSKRTKIRFDKYSTALSIPSWAIDGKGDDTIFFKKDKKGIKVI